MSNWDPSTFKHVIVVDIPHEVYMHWHSAYFFGKKGQELRKAGMTVNAFQDLVAGREVFEYQGVPAGYHKKLYCIATDDADAVQFKLTKLSL